MSHVTHMNESCRTLVTLCVIYIHIYIYMSHVAHETHIWTHISYEWVMSRICNTHEWVSWRIWISYVTHVNESCHNSSRTSQPLQLCITYERVTSLVCHTHEYVMCVTHMNWSRDRHEWVMSLTRMSHFSIHNGRVSYQNDVTSINESGDTFEWVVSLTWMSRVTHVNESCFKWSRTSQQLKPLSPSISMSPLPRRYVCGSWPINKHNCAPWLIHYLVVRDSLMGMLVYYYSFITWWVSWLITRHDCVSWLIHYLASWLLYL